MAIIPGGRKCRCGVILKTEGGWNKHQNNHEKHGDFAPWKPEGSTRISHYSFTWTKHLTFSRDDGICQGCKRPVIKVNNDKDINQLLDYEIHHIRSVHDGGSDHPENLMLLCRTCHLKTFKRKGRSGLPASALHKTIDSTLNRYF